MLSSILGGCRYFIKAKSYFRNHSYSSFQGISNSSTKAHGQTDAIIPLLHSSSSYYQSFFKVLSILLLGGGLYTSQKPVRCDNEGFTQFIQDFFDLFDVSSKLTLNLD